MFSSSDKLGLGASTALQTGLVSDPASYKSLAASARTGSAAGLEAAARAFESLLVGQMLKQMRAASLADSLFDSSQSRLYQDLFDQQAATVLSEGEGMGIRKALMRQLAPELTGDRDERDADDLIVPERNPLLRSFKRRKVDAAVDAVTGVGGQKESAASKASGGTLKVSATGQWPPSSAEEFVAYLKPYADQAAEILGMDTSVLLAQSALETGWGKHVPRRSDGSSSFNLFGIKADRSWKGDKVGVGTLEYRNGVARREQAKFRAYHSPADSFVDYVAFLKRNPRYGEALQSETGEDFVRGLQKAGYATDPRYASKILSIRDRLLRISAAIETQPAQETQVSVIEADTPAEG
ncbi:flagellar assembly peptidoglycan hydrolase FlgJ [Thiorhodococcus mannitoliphagus]|uniref:Peptidoglycan hydrolase FlgJ n=1 Tax=Thiorhodococcus mannitoliphagus TaxID=329406 RepID=A0A6P1DWG9_9GAMM|nr:flagellar assembly peptidoglycan hydrolase FlgJ [Thiorhodococcus mannitoliphagus]NEX21066.1 flagellar assembly peptidoglycan hydrolase FlgJ [Thiorhodococcus mannitoliphagus]